MGHHVRWCGVFGGGGGGRRRRCCVVLCFGTRIVCAISQARGCCLLGRPGLPACGACAHGFRQDAIDGAYRNAKLAPCAVVLQHRVHVLGGAHDGIDWTCLDAQGAADAPVFVDVGKGAWRFGSMSPVQGNDWPPRHGGQAYDALIPTRGALVDASFVASDSLGIAGAVRIPAACALRLRQDGVNPRGQRSPVSRSNRIRPRPSSSLVR